MYSCVCMYEYLYSRVFIYVYSNVCVIIGSHLFEVNFSTRLLCWFTVHVLELVKNFSPTPNCHALETSVCTHVDYKYIHDSCSHIIF